MYSAPLRETSHQQEREAWAKRLREAQTGREDPPATPPPLPARRTPGLTGDAALVGLILFLLSDHTKNDGVLLCILVYLLLS